MFKIRTQCEFDAWHLFVDEPILEVLLKFTEQNGVLIKWSDLLKFITLQ